MHSVSPVWTENEVDMERVVALDQPEYFPIIVLPIKYNLGEGPVGLSVRFRLTDAERLAIQVGGDIVITELTGGQFTPINIQVVQPYTVPE